MRSVYVDCGLEIKAATDDGRIEGLGAVFGNVDLGMDRIEKGAFEDTIADLRTIPMLWQHRDDQPIGVWDEFAETRKGLVVGGQINLDTQLGAEARSLAKQGAVTGLSIGYWPIDYKYEDDVRVLEKVALHEVSLVTFPMNPEARTLGLKNFTRKQLETMLRECGLSRYRASRVAYKLRDELDDDRPDSGEESDAINAVRQLKEIFQ